MALVPTFAQRKQQVHKPSLAPDIADHSYGPHERNVLDLWKAKSGRPTPLVIYIHGGAFAHGDKSQAEYMVLPAPDLAFSGVYPNTFQYGSL